MEILAQILICLKAASEKWNRSDVSAEGFRLCWFVLMEVKLLLCDKHADPSEPSSGFWDIRTLFDCRNLFFFFLGSQELFLDEGRLVSPQHSNMAAVCLVTR